MVCNLLFPKEARYKLQYHQQIFNIIRTNERYK